MAWLKDREDQKGEKMENGKWEGKAVRKIRCSCICTYRSRATTLSTNSSFLNSGIQCMLKDVFVLTSLKPVLIWFLISALYKINLTKLIVSLTVKSSFEL